MSKKYCLNDIAGYKEEKAELKKIIEMFNNYDEYKKKGAYLSKGLILSGDPGVGKTLFARVLASEINAPLIMLDGAELGGSNGARKIKNAFKKASSKSPAMIFIDELNMFVGDEDYYSDYTKRNLSCLLKQIDGIKQNQDIFVVGASSDKDELDSALLRSGRMDKHICIGIPTANSRKEILEFYLNQITLKKEDLDLKRIVDLTQGLTGADLKTIVNEATLEAINNKSDVLTIDNLLNTVTKVKNKDINRNNEVPYEHIYHDIGHMVVANALLNKFNSLDTKDNNYVGNSTIDFLSLSFDYLEDDYYDDDDDDYYYDEEDEEMDEYYNDHTNELNKENDSKFNITKKNAMNVIAVFMGGMACEEVVLNNGTLVNYVDFNKAAKIIDFMLGAGFFGFEYMAMHNISEDKPLIGKSRDLIEEKKIAILNEAYDIALSIINKNVDKIKNLYNLYNENEEISRLDALNILQN